MSFKAILILILCFLSFAVKPQELVSMQKEGDIDEWRTRIGQLPQSQSYVDAVLAMVKIMHDQRHPEDTIMNWLAKAEYVADMVSYEAGLREVYRHRAITYEIFAHDYSKGLQWYHAALRLADTDNEHHDLFTSILNLNFYLGHYINAMSIASKGLRMAEAVGDEKRIAHYHNVIGFIHLRQGNAVASQQSYKQYHRLALSLRDTTMIGDAYNCLAETYLLQKNFGKATEYFFLAKRLYEDLHSRQKLIKQDRLPYTLFKIGVAYGMAENIGPALHYVEQSIEFSKRTSCNLYDVASYYIYAGYLYQQSDQPARSLWFLRSGLTLAKTIGHKENIRDAYLYLHQLFASTGNYDSAYAYYALYDRLKDSISNEKTRAEIQQIEASYLVEKKDKEIELLLQKQALDEAKTKRKLLLRNLVIIFFGLVTVIIAFVLNRKELRRKNMLQQEINRRQNEIFNIVSSTQDQERKRIAQDLHDGMGTLLSAAKLKLSGMNEKEESAIGETIQILDEAVSELRNISHNIMPATLSRIGLVGALQNFFGRVTNPGITFNFIHHGFTGRIEEEKEMIVYRVILELVNNAVKHSGATAVTIQLVKYPDHINLIVEDNGRGMPKDATASDGIGLKSISSRISYLNGTFTLDTGGGGTTAIIDIPT